MDFLRSNHRVFRDGFAEIRCAELWRSFLSLVVDIDETEPVRKAVAPFKIVHEAPVKIALYRRALCGCPMEMSKVVAKEHDAIRVVDDPVSGDIVARPATILGDIDLLGIP